MTGSITETAIEVYRDYVVDGLPASGTNKPNKAAIRGLNADIDSAMGLVAAAVAVGSAIVKDTLAHLNADLLHAANTIGVVWGDGTAANNGLYVKTGSSGSGAWVQLNIALPATITALVEADVAAAQDAATDAGLAETAAAGSAASAASSAAASAASATLAANEAAIASAAAVATNGLTMVSIATTGTTLPRRSVCTFRSDIGALAATAPAISSMAEGEYFEVQDGGFNAANHNITITAAGSDVIVDGQDNVASIVIDLDGFVGRFTRNNGKLSFRRIG